MTEPTQHADYERLNLYFVTLPTGGYIHFKSKAEMEAYMAEDDQSDGSEASLGGGACDES